MSANGIMDEIHLHEPLTAVVATRDSLRNPGLPQPHVGAETQCIVLERTAMISLVASFLSGISVFTLIRFWHQKLDNRAPGLRVAI